MSLLSPRVPEHFDFSSPSQALARIRQFHKLGHTIRLFDAVEESIGRFPAYAIPTLALAYEYFHELDNKSRYEQYQSRIFDFPIKSNDKILDIGSGNLPFPPATQLADLSLTDNALGRAGGAFKMVQGKPVTECSVEKTPFADKEFDFVYCSHVLEHTPHPATACQELMRIAKRGYIETPTKGKDIFLNTARAAHHLNYVELQKGILTFFRYEDWQKDGLGNDILLQMHCAPQTEREKAFSALMYLRPRQINTMLMWEENFEFQVCFEPE